MRVSLAGTASFLMGVVAILACRATPGTGAGATPPDATAARPTTPLEIVLGRDATRARYVLLEPTTSSVVADAPIETVSIGPPGDQPNTPVLRVETTAPDAAPTPSPTVTLVSESAACVLVAAPRVLLRLSYRVDAPGAWMDAMRVDADACPAPASPAEEIALLGTHREARRARREGGVILTRQVMSEGGAWLARIPPDVRQQVEADATVQLRMWTLPASKVTAYERLDAQARVTVLRLYEGAQLIRELPRMSLVAFVQLRGKPEALVSDQDAPWSHQLVPIEQPR